MPMLTVQDAQDMIRGHQVHRDVYTSEEVYRLEMRYLFRNTWVFVGHDSQTPNKGDYFTTQVGDQPVIQVRHSDGEIYVLYNRCPHKGTKIAIDRTGNTGKFFRCPYHAWSFKTNGCLLAIPLKKGYEGTGLSDTDNGQGMKAVGAVKKTFTSCSSITRQNVPASGVPMGLPSKTMEVQPFSSGA